jgi:hypothetical protein
MSKYQKYGIILQYAGKGIRTPARFHVAVFETAALPLGYPGNVSRIIFIIKQMDRSTIYYQCQKVHFGIFF